jgi:hypothetical protein
MIIDVLVRTEEVACPGQRTDSVQERPRLVRLVKDGEVQVEQLGLDEAAELIAMELENQIRLARERRDG